MTTTRKKIKFAIVGCGRIYGKHFDALKQYPDDAEVVAICDSDPKILEERRLEHKVSGYLSLSEMLKKSDAEVVTIATPSGLHARQTIEVAQAGRHVVCEKPMATKWIDGKEMVAACDAAGTQLFIVKQNRKNPTLQLLKEAIQLGRFGKIYMVNINVFWNRNQDYYDQSPWRGKWEFDGGAVMNQASHYVDLLTWLLGPVESVHAFAATLARNIEAEDSAVINLRWRSGILGSMNVTMLTYPKNFEGSITIIGEKGTVRIGGVAVNKIEKWEFVERHDMDSEIEKANYDTSSVYGKGHIPYYGNVIKTLQGLERSDTDGREGLNSLELLTAIYRSARDSQPISLPLDF